MIRKYSFYAVLFIILFFLFTFCSKKEQQESGQIAQQEGMQSDSTVQTIKPKAINYDSMLIVIGDLTKYVKENPTDINLRQKLVAASYDTTWETILAAGFGKSSKKDSSESISLKLTERAAKADAYRWAAYIKKWSDDPTIPDIGSLSTEIRGGIIVAKKNLPDSTTMVLLEVQKSKIH